MKKLIIYVCLLMPLVFQSCKKEFSPGDNYDFSNSLPPYITFRSTAAIAVKEGASATIPLGMRTSLQETVTVTLTVAGAVNSTVTVVLPVESTSFNGAVAVPVGAVAAPATTGTATVTLTKAVTASGKVLTIGANNVASAQKITLNISK